MRAFISGPMSGLPNFNREAFNAVAEKLRALGYAVENPAENPECPDWLGYMRLSIAQMMRCDTVIALPGWTNSRGAAAEVTLARNIGMPVYGVDAFFAQHQQKTACGGAGESEEMILTNQKE